MKLAIITGADGGMGQALTLRCAQAGFRIVMACRDTDQALPAYEKIKKQTNATIDLIPINLASFASILAFVNSVKNEYRHIDLLLNNAGILCHQPKTTENGIEMTVGVNYLGPYILTHLLLPLLGEGSRIVNMGSLSYRWTQINEQFFLPISGKFNRFLPYSRSKRALLFFTLDIAEMCKNRGICVNYADPGIVSTKIIRMGNPFIDKLCDIFYRPFLKTPTQGAATMLHLALSEETAHVTGACYVNKKQKNIPDSLLHSEERTLLHNITREILLQHHIILS